MIDVRFQMRGIDLSAKGLRRALPRLKKDALLRTARWYHREVFMQKKFSRRGAREYDYAPREGEPGHSHPKGWKRSYTARKLREHGHTNPLVWSGLSRLAARFARVSATSRKATIRIPFPAMSYRPADARIDIREELESISRRDREGIVQHFFGIMWRGIKKIRTRTTTNIK